MNEEDKEPLAFNCALMEELREIDRGRWKPPAAELPADAPLGEIYKYVHSQPPNKRPMALCLSGGGIRSATFCLGVLQALARSGRLRSFHYLSTVSGGGYIGSWLANWMYLKKWSWKEVLPVLQDGTMPAPQPPQPSENAEKTARDDPVAQLRGYSNYLSPVWGLSADALSVVAIFLRNLLLNLVVWFSLIMAMAALPRLYLALLAPPFPPASWVNALLAIAVIMLVVGIAYVVADLPGDRFDEVGVATQMPEQRKSSFFFCCFLPVVFAAVLFSVAGVWAADLRNVSYGNFILAGVFVHLVGIVAGLSWRKRRDLPTTRDRRTVGGGLMVVVTGAVGGWLLWKAFAGMTPSEDAEHSLRLTYATWAVPVMLGCFWLAMTFYAGAARRWTTEDDREWWARATAWWLFLSVGWVLAFSITMHLPLWLFDTFGAKLPGGVELGLSGSVLGVVTAMIGYWSENGSKIKRKAEGVLKVIGLRMLDLMALLAALILLIVMSLSTGWMLERCEVKAICRHDLHAMADHLRRQAALDTMPGAKAQGDGEARSGATQGNGEARPGEAHAFETVLLRSDWRVLFLGVLGLILLAATASWRIGANTFSLHGMYGNRLVRAYLGAARTNRNPHWFTGFDPEDDVPLHETWPKRNEVGERSGDCPPFHVVNIALNLVAASRKRLAWQQRKAASFTATPLRCGSEALGYVRSELYGGHQGITLGRALTISGAAASPNMGYHSSALVTFMMTLTNVRLGWWLANPKGKLSRHWLRDPVEKRLKSWRASEPPFALRAVLNEAFSRTTDDRKSIYLSDGGHFDNLGIYEMVRRRCHRIVVVDATCDSGFDYADLLDVVSKIRVDLGVPIELPRTLPGPGRKTHHPRMVVGRILYSACDPRPVDANGEPCEIDGYLYVIKPVLTGDEPPQLAHYASHDGGGTQPFPHQSTTDQFFDETQFESYRLLGMVSAEQCFADDRWPSEDPPLSNEDHNKKHQDGCACKECRPAAAGGGAFGGMLQDVGTGAALATALTVGGTLGVAGTVALQPSEIRLSNEDRELLRKGMSSEIRLASEDRELLRKGMASEIRFASEDRKLFEKGINGEIGIRGEDRELLKLLQIQLEKLDAESLQKAAASLSEAAERLKGSELNPSIIALSQRIDSMRIAVEKKDMTVKVDLEPVRKELEKIDGNLQGLRNVVGEVSPRRNVRGQEGGSR